MTDKARLHVSIDLTEEEMAQLTAYTEAECRRTGYRLSISDVARGMVVRHLQTVRPKQAVRPKEAGAEHAPTPAQPPPPTLELLTSRVNELELPTHAMNILWEKECILLLGQLVQKTWSELLKIRGFGQKSLRYTIAALADKGLCLGMELDEDMKAAIENAAKAFPIPASMT